VRQNKLSQRLKSKLDSFGFDALIKGVSTLVEEAPEVTPDAPESDAVIPELGAATGEAPVPVQMTALLEPLVAEPAATPAIQTPVVARTETIRRTSIFEPVEAPRGPERTPVESPEPPARSVPAPAVMVLEPPTAEPAELPTSRPAEAPRKAIAPEPLREALWSLSCRLTQEVGRMAAALDVRDAEEAGFYLAHANQILELLHTLDPRGDMSRQLDLKNAPPAGRAWPLTAWTVVEFAESPFSALLPANAGESFVREVIYAAWGISFSS